MHYTIEGDKTMAVHHTAYNRYFFLEGCQLVDTIVIKVML
jgi:hypothetical protein